MTGTQQQQSKSDKDDWQTPEWLWGLINKYDPIDLDPCPGDGTEIGKHNIDPHHHDGLDYPWEGTVFVNPPYSEKTEWIAKCAEEAERSTVDRIYLITPDSTDVGEWWHAHIAPNCSHTIFFKYRVNFIDPKTGEEAGNPPFGTALHVFGDVRQSVIKAFEAHDRGTDIVTRATGFR